MLNFDFLEIIDWDLIVRIFRTLIFSFLFYFIFVFLSKKLKRKILKRVEGKKHKSNVKIFFQALNYLILGLTVLFAVLSFVGSFTGIGIAAGLLTASLGWALQRPITGFAAWIMIVLKRPFEIGDRIIVAGIKGDVIDISLTHLHVGEIGGTINSEESSGRVILIPNSRLFEENIVNYTLTSEEILDLVHFVITFDSDVSEVEKIAIEAAKKVKEKYGIAKNSHPYIREFFNVNGIQIQLRYYTDTLKREEISSQITKLLIEEIKKSEKIRFAYPHTEVILTNRDKE